MYLVDTDILAAGAPSRAVLPALIEWMDAHSAVLFLSAVTVAEIEGGIAKARREGATRKASHLAAWLETLLHLYGDRVLAFDAPTARSAGAMADRARAKSRAPGFAEIIVAATAHHHGPTILSRNLKHFEPPGVPVLDPFTALPPA